MESYESKEVVEFETVSGAAECGIANARRELRLSPTTKPSTSPQWGETGQ